jgi:hypothetical protein
MNEWCNCAACIGSKGCARLKFHFLQHIYIAKNTHRKHVRRMCHFKIFAGMKSVSLYCRFIDTVGTQMVISESDQWQICHGSSVIVYTLCTSIYCPSKREKCRLTERYHDYIINSCLNASQSNLLCRIKRLPVHIYNLSKSIVDQHGVYPLRRA